ncbi:unnamed protein product [Peniophora sp. CBMAI 1063]|nr:unnamed protein product [Peniophora sp. CBMAI 1063]
MADDADMSSEWTRITHELLFNYALQAAPLVLLYYDYFLTLGDEVENYWPPRRALTWLSGLFLGTRYFTLLACGPVQYYHAFLELVLQIPIGLLCALRVYALYSKDRRILVGLLVLGAILTGVILYMVTTFDTNIPVFYWSRAPLCGNARSRVDGIRFAIVWGAVLLFDLIVFILTALRAFKVWKSGRIVQVVLRDGVLYFCALSASNIVNIVVLVVVTPLLKTVFASLTNILSVVLISRLMLNLRSDTVSSSDVFPEDTELTVASASLDTNILVSEGRSDPTVPRAT